MDVLLTLADVIRNRRAELGKTQEELAEMLSMSQEWVTGVETGKILEPRLKTLQRVSLVMGIPVEELLIAARMATSQTGARRVIASIGMNEAPSRSDPHWDDPSMQIVMSRAQKMTPQQRRKLAELMDSLGFGNDQD